MRGVSNDLSMLLDKCGFQVAWGLIDGNAVKVACRDIEVDGI